MLTDDLKSLGLTDQEVQIYLAGVELGPCTVLELAKKIGSHRTTIYHTVQDLLDNKLFSESARGKKRVFVAEGPNAFKKMLLAKLDRVDGIAGELVALARASTTKPVVKFYVGVSGIKEVFRRSVLEAKDKVQYGIFSVEQLTSSKALSDAFLGEFSALRVKHKIFGKIVVADTEGGKGYKALDAEKYRETKMLPASSYNFPAEIMVYDNIVHLIVISEKEQFAVTVESPAIAATVKMIFELCWKQGY